jgi:hypothetical protein
VTAIVHPAAQRAARSLWLGLTWVVAAIVLAAFVWRTPVHPAARWLVVAGAVWAVYLGARLVLDALVFGRWARAADLTQAMRDFDAGLARRGLRRPADPSRGLAERIDGAMRLRHWSMLCVLAQSSVGVAAFFLA